MKIKLIILGCLAVTALLNVGYSAQNNEVPGRLYAPQGDTTGFAANTSDEWATLQLYFEQVTPDSVLFELVVSQKKSKKRDEEIYVGTITDAKYRPSQDVVYEYFLLRDNVWSIKVKSNGECFIKQESGRYLKEKPFVFPFKMRFKNTQ